MLSDSNMIANDRITSETMASESACTEPFLLQCLSESLATFEVVSLSDNLLHFPSFATLEVVTKMLNVTKMLDMETLDMKMPNMGMLDVRMLDVSMLDVTKILDMEKLKVKMLDILCSGRRYNMNILCRIIERDNGRNERGTDIAEMLVEFDLLLSDIIGSIGTQHSHNCSKLGDEASGIHCCRNSASSSNSA
jgi:hypothetical protein